jgi:hypothetical protein
MNQRMHAAERRLTLAFFRFWPWPQQQQPNNEQLRQLYNNQMMMMPQFLVRTKHLATVAESAH